MENIGDLSVIWQIMFNNIRDEHTMPETAVDLWFGNFNIKSLTTDKVVFASESEMKCNIIKDRYTELLSEHLNRVIGFSPDVEITVDEELSDGPLEDDGTISPIRRIHQIREELASSKSAESDIRNKVREKSGESYGIPDFDSSTEAEKDARTLSLTQEELKYMFFNDEEDSASFAESEAMEEEERIIHQASFLDKSTDQIQSDRTEKKSGEKRLSFNTDYTFDNFIVGSSNQLAHAAALSVADNPGRKYNPLFIYGHSGLGKTHLMYAIANRVLEKNSSMKVIYVKGEEFMNQLIESIKVQKNSEFREKYRKTDMLLIDDIQFIAGKDSTQEEFFHTFDALYEDHKQLIITSDKPPREMTTLEERIRSRFESGLIIDIQPPDFELRLAILQNKADQNNLVIPTDVMTYLAERLQSNIRQIEGVIKKLGANHFLSGMPVTMDMVRSSVPEFIRENESVSDFVDKIIDCVARRFKATSEDLLGRKRNKEIKNARNIAMYIIRSLTTLSLPKIGAVFGRDYSTVHSNLSAVEKQICCDSVLEAEINDIIKEIKRL